MLTAVMSETPLLKRFEVYRLEQLFAVLGEPWARKNARPSPQNAASSSAPDATAERSGFEIRESIVEQPVHGALQWLIWMCADAANGRCVAFGDPFADQWHTLRLCIQHGGIPYDEATEAGEDEWALRKSRISEFWSCLAEFLPHVRRTTESSIEFNDCRFRFEQEPKNSSIREVTNLNYCLWRGEPITENRLAEGSYYLVNATGRRIALDFAVSSLEGRMVELKPWNAPWVRGRLRKTSLKSKVDITLADGSALTFGTHKIEAIHEQEARSG